MGGLTRRSGVAENFRIRNVLAGRTVEKGGSTDKRTDPLIPERNNNVFDLKHRIPLVNRVVHDWVRFSFPFPILLRLLCSCEAESGERMHML